jgi:hypothetical protein
MNCRHLENELALYVEGDLPPARTSGMDMHLLSCEQCRQVVEELRETQSVFKSIRQDTASPQELAHLRTRVLGQVAARTLRPAWGRWVCALAGVGFVVAVAVGIVTMYKHSAANVQQVVQRQPVEPQSIERHSPPVEGGVSAPPKGEPDRAKPQDPKGEPDRAKPQEMAQTGWLSSTDKHVRNYPGATSVDASPDRARASRHPSLKRRGVGEPQPPKPAEPPKEIMVKLLTDDPNVVIYWLVDQNGGAL